MTRSRLSDSELAVLAARIQQNYDYDDRSGLLVNAKTNRVVRGEKYCKRNGKHRYLSMRAYINGQRYHILMFDNRIENLREVTQSENQRNQHRPWKPNAKSGLPGVYKNGSGYRIKVAQHHYHFRDKYEAFYHLTLLGRRFKLEVRGEK